MLLCGFLKLCSLFRRTPPAPDKHAGDTMTQSTIKPLCDAADAPVAHSVDTARTLEVPSTSNQKAVHIQAKRTVAAGKPPASVPSPTGTVTTSRNTKAPTARKMPTTRTGEQNSQSVSETPGLYFAVSGVGSPIADATAPTGNHHHHHHHGGLSGSGCGPSSDGGANPVSDNTPAPSADTTVPSTYDTSRVVRSIVVVGSVPS
ncbi:hypothetical protein DFH09DRAFT_1342378 [Mycena vulgaris]|nr:hypothetical protein DFH09DRAFT_1342378 [Mycena vulgaris]